MKRQWKMILCLLLAAITLSSCASNPEEQPKVFAEMTQALGPAGATTPDPQAGQQQQQGGEQQQDQGIFAQNPYDISQIEDIMNEFAAADPMAEEQYGFDDGMGGDYGEGFDDGMGSSADLINDDGFGGFAVAADPYATPYPYAGSTPIPLDPVDMPSPPPRTEIVFNYVPYTIASLGLTFEGPAGWVPDETVSEMFTLSEPPEQMKDGQLGIITIYATPIASHYSENNLKAEINQRLKNIGATNFTKWEPSLTATRHLMGSMGVYAQYSGTMVDGLQIGGRIHSVSIDNVLYTIEIVYPLSYREDFLNVFSQMRTSIKRQ